MVLQVRQRPSLRVRWELTRLRVGTGKTMLVKAVANNTSAAFIRVVGSEFVQKYLGEGPRMVRDVFRLARENAPAIIFIDEIDAIATKRFDAQTGADREVQRILLELLNQMDGFDQGSNVKVIMATNRADTLVSLSLLS
jgi:26S proteasome regulatory subunit T3